MFSNKVLILCLLRTCKRTQPFKLAQNCEPNAISTMVSIQEETQHTTISVTFKATVGAKHSLW